LGKSQGAKVKFAVANVAAQNRLKFFTTRIDTIYGATAVILAPGHPLVSKLLDGSPVRGEAEPKAGENRQASVKNRKIWRRWRKKDFCWAVCRESV